MRIRYCAMLAMMLITFEAQAGKFQTMIYDAAEKECTAMGKTQLNRKEWLECMELWIRAKHEVALSDLGLSAPPHMTPEEAANETCEKRQYWSTLNVKDYDGCYNIMLPMTRNAERKIWSQNSMFDKQY